MAASNAQAVKAAIITALQALQGTTLAGVQVEYSFPRDLMRECIYGGRIQGNQEIGAGRSSGNTSRDERVVILLHLRVSKPGGTCADAEARALAIGAVVEGYLAANTPSATGLLDASIDSFDLDSDIDDDGAYALLTYRIQTQSYIT